MGEDSYLMIETIRGKFGGRSAQIRIRTLLRELGKENECGNPRVNKMFPQGGGC
jgi:hypothetical protein